MTDRRRTLFTMLLLVFLGQVMGQATWRRTYGGYGTDEGVSVLQLGDSSYLVSGSTGSFGAGGDVYLLRLDTLGDLMWSRTYGGVNVDVGTGSSLMTDGNVVLSAYTNEPGLGGYDGVLAVFDTTGEPIFDRRYGGPDWDFLYDVEASPSGFFATGSTYVPGLGAQLWLIRTDLAGDTVWTRSWGTAGEDEARAVKPTLDGGCVVAGTVATLDGYTDAVLVRFDATGTLLWTSTFGGDSLDAGHGVVITQDGGYVLGGESDSYSVHRSMLIGKCDATGQEVWTKTVGQIADWAGREIIEKADGTLLMAGYTKAFGGGGSDMYLLYCDANGDYLDGRTYGGSEEEEAFALALTKDDGVIVVGSATTYGPGPKAVFVVKGDEMGFTASLLVDAVLDPLPVYEIAEVREALVMYPSPLRSGMPLKVECPFSGATRSKLLDATGRLCYAWEMREGLNVVQLPPLPSGVYGLQIEGPSGQRASDLLIID